VIADLHRTLPAMVAMWMVSFPMRLHPVTHHDAVLSLQRGYTKAELTAVLREAGVVTVVSRKPIARLVAVWRPARTLSAPGERLT
jgi:hypothetical protein